MARLLFKAIFDVKVTFCALAVIAPAQSLQESICFHDCPLSEYSNAEFVFMISGSFSMADRRTSSDDVSICASVNLPVCESNVTVMRDG
jgi:hypothetical protein